MQERGTQAVETPYQLYSAASLVRLRTAVAAIPMQATARFHARRELQAIDKNDGASAPSRRNRCAAAVEVLLDMGADPQAINRSGSAAQLARWTTGRGGSGSAEAQAQRKDTPVLQAAGGA